LLAHAEPDAAHEQDTTDNQSKPCGRTHIHLFGRNQP
jgi:hypothetical protein